MTIHHTLIILFLTPTLLSAQNNIDTPKCKTNVTSSDIYSIVNYVVRQEKLNKNYGLNTAISRYCYENEPDSIFLKWLLIKEEKVDTTTNIDTSKTLQLNQIVLTNLLSYPDKNILTLDDIDYIDCEKSVFSGDRWNLHSLGFKAKNKKGFYYTFSLPYFNVQHDKVIFMYTFSCPGLCGSGKTILLKKKGDTWDKENLALWFH